MRSKLITWSEIDLLAGLIYGEARGEPWSGKVGVGLVVRNRVNQPGFWNWGRNWREVILKPKQFSCFNPANKNLPKIIEAKDRKGLRWQECRMIAEQIYLDRVADFLGATHYHNINVRPEWRLKLKYLVTIGLHKFYRVGG